MEAPAPIAPQHAQQPRARAAIEAQRRHDADAGGEPRLHPAEARRAQEDDEVALRPHQP
jgi:hypothetical protein